MQFTTSELTDTSEAVQQSETLSGLLPGLVVGKGLYVAGSDMPPNCDAAQLFDL